MNIKKIKIIYTVIVIITICWISIVIYLHNSKKIEQTSEPSPVPVKQNKDYQRVQMNRLKLTIYDEADNVLTIKGDSFTVEKKKIGFLRTSIFNEAKIKNGVIDLHSKSIMNGSNGKPEYKTLFKKAVSKDTLSSFFGHKISSISVRPVCISIYQNDRLIARISASSGRVGVKNKGILFSGNVSIESGTSKLITEKLSLNTGNATIQTHTAYELITDKGNFKGSVFSSDIFLQPISMENKL